MNAIVAIFREFASVFGEMAPYLLFGFFAAGLLSIFISAETVEKHLGGRGLGPVLKAAFWGVPLPLCSCSVIPVATSLRRHGAGRGATAAFLLSTPQTGVDSILVTYGLLGPVFAIFRPVAAFVTGLVGGALVNKFGNGNAGDGTEQAEACHEECCEHKERRGRFLRALHYGFVTLPRDIGKELIVGLLIAGLITALVPQDLFSDAIGPGFLQMLLMMAVGIPMYVCASASVPIAAALMLKGVSPGAAFVFLMTGPATNAATIVTIRKILGTRSAAIYLLTVAAMALVCGVLLDHVFGVAGAASLEHAHSMMPAWVKISSSAALLAVLAFALWPRKAPVPTASP
jgi:uncharacterized protein